MTWILPKERSWQGGPILIKMCSGRYLKARQQIYYDYIYCGRELKEATLYANKDMTWFTRPAVILSLLGLVY